jgi:hypothetical protein
MPHLEFVKLEDQMAYHHVFASDEERKAFRAKQDAFWNRPSHEVIGDLVIPGTPGSKYNKDMSLRDDWGNVVSLAKRRAQKPGRLTAYLYGR